MVGSGAPNDLSDTELAALIQISAKGGYYEGESAYIGEADNEIVEGWFQLPVFVQVVATLTLMMFGFQWWSAILWAWLPSVVMALAVRWSSSHRPGKFGLKFRYFALLVAFCGVGYGLFHGDWTLVIIAGLSIYGLPGVLSPAFVLMNAGGDEHPKYSYATRALGIRFPHQAARERLQDFKPNKEQSEETAERVL
jgi:hypothetical protein